ncbi:MAG: hypothetical protein ACKO2D_13625 [Chloroflexota bacterium]
MDDFAPLAPEMRGSDLRPGSQAVGRRRPTPAQRRREATIDRRLELASAGGGLVLALACATAGAWSLSAALGIDRFAVVAILGAIAALGGSVLAAHFAVTIARITGYAGPSPADPALAVPLETWLVAILLGGIGGGATGIDLGTLVLIVGGRTPWDLPPATTMTAVVALPLVGLLPLAVAVGAAARRAWLRRPVLVAGVTWLAGSVAGTIVSGVWSHLPGV